MVAVHRILIACVALLVCAAPAEAACSKAEGSLRFSVASSGPIGQKVARLCDRRTGRSRVVARRVSAVRVTRPRVALASSRQGRITITVHDLRTGRRERRIAAGRGNTFDDDLVLSTRGEVAWLIRRPERGSAVLAVRPGRGRVTIAARNADAVELENEPVVGLEDDRTVRYSVAGDLRFFDLRRPPRRAGCPVRSEFATTLSTPDMLITTARYGVFDSGNGRTEVIRACLRTSGEDPVVAQANANDSGGDGVSVVGARAGWFVLSTGYSTKYDADGSSSSSRSAESRSVRHIDGRPGRAVRECEGRGLRVAFTGDPVTVTDAGVAAWIRDSRVLAAGADGCVTELDRGDVAALSASGAQVTWTNAGEPRSATP